ncbi:response regulator transcription factor [Amycolatopsis rhizosphaerae]|uniref:Response regulator transcription factor n=2 Tax=Amycolatopsis rhizosphaerae TaxID=2053003 RepID=A0A558A656_9PSEU|nr:response regulator transcription factor [Amycolatopsis rhizosphaerae]
MSVAAVPHAREAGTSGRELRGQAGRPPGVATVVIVDEQSLVRYALRSLLAKLPGIEVVGEADSPGEALRQMHGRRPDLLVTGLEMEKVPAAAELCRLVKRNPVPTSVIVMSPDSGPASVAAAVNAGADSFVDTSASCREIVDVIRSAVDGHRSWVLGSRKSPSRLPRPECHGGFTRREKEILGLMLDRLSNEEIAEELHLAPQTVKNYVSRVLQKHSVKSRRDLFRKLGLHRGASASPRYHQYPAGG